MRHVDVDLLAPAHAANLPLLQRPQQLGLQHQRQLPQFVEKERAVIRKFQQADPPAFGPGERRLARGRKTRSPIRLSGIAPQSTGTNGPAAPAATVDAAGNQLLARAGLAADQHVDVRVRHLLDQLEHFSHCRAAADDIVEAVGSFHLPAQQIVFGADAALAQQPQGAGSQIV